MNSYTVSQINSFIKQIFSYEEIFYGINVEGEISNLKYNGFGNMYFTLKDEKSSISCVFFKDKAELVGFMPENGMLVVVRGDIGLYEVYGRCQIYGISMQQTKKEGDILKRLNALKNKFLKEGLFSLENKKKIPKYPKKIGVIAANGGAAIEDIKKIISTRFSVVKLYVYYAIMQGKNAPKSIEHALKIAKGEKLDLIIVARGGGSKEDLNVFDEEDVVRLFSDVEVPVVSAIGHENDWSITDLVADLRASTPSSAALMVCPDYLDLLEKIRTYRFMFKRQIKEKMEELTLKLKNIRNDFSFFSPKKQYEKLNEKIIYFKRFFKNLILLKYNVYLNIFDKRQFILKSLNPKIIFEKGFALILDENGKKVETIGRTFVGKVLNICLKDGELFVKVFEKKVKKIDV